MKRVLALLYQIFIFTPIFLIATIATAITVMIGCAIGNRKFWSCNPPATWSRFTCQLALCRIKVRHLGNIDPSRSYVFIANHQGAFDIFLMYGYLGKSVKWVQKKELRAIPFVGKASEIAGHVFVDQSSIKSINETIVKTRTELQHGTSIAIFPEGARTETGKMRKFKRGAFLIAKEMKLPIVPVTVNGPFDVMKIYTYLVNPGRLELVIHDPIDTENIEDKDLPALMEQCYNTIHSSLWEKYK